MSSDAPLLIQNHGPVRRLVLNRPAAHHAIDLAVVQALEAAVAEIERKDDIRVVVLAAQGGPVFCSGGDLDWFASLKAAESVEIFARVTAVLDRLWSGSKPVLAELAGDAYGGGLEVASAAHIRLCAAGVKLAFRQAAMGVVTGFGGATRLFAGIPSGALLPLLLSAESFDPGRALAIGLVHEVHPKEALAARVEALAQAIATQSPAALAGFLELFRKAAEGERAALAAKEAQLFQQGFLGGWFRGKLRAWTSRSRDDRADGPS